MLADTAGRLPTSSTLVEEIAKVRRVIAKADERAARGAAGARRQHRPERARAGEGLDKAIGVTGLVVTKLDGTAKGRRAGGDRPPVSKPLRFIGGVGGASTTFSRSRRAEVRRCAVRTGRRRGQGRSGSAQMIVFEDVAKRYAGGYAALAASASRSAMAELGRALRPFRRGQEHAVHTHPGHQRPTAGRVLINGQDVSHLPRTAIPYLRRNLGLVLRGEPPAVRPQKMTT